MRLELLAGDEEVIAAMTARRGAAAGWSRRPRPGAAGPGARAAASTSVLLPDPEAPERTISRPGRSVQSVSSHRASSHSTFWTSSRIFSRSPLISTTLRLISTSLAFEPIVFTSRPISWTTNSSLRPRALGLVEDLLVLDQVGPQAGRSPRRCRSDRPGWRPRGSGPWASIGHSLVLDQGWTRSVRRFWYDWTTRGPRSAIRARWSSIACPRDWSSVGHGPAFLGPGRLELVERLADHPGDLRPVVVRDRSRPAGSPRPRRAGPGAMPRSTGRPIAALQRLELIAVARQGHGVEPVVLGLPGPLDPARSSGPPRAGPSRGPGARAPPRAPRTAR